MPMRCSGLPSAPVTASSRSRRATGTDGLELSRHARDLGRRAGDANADVCFAEHNLLRMMVQGRIADLDPGEGGLEGDVAKRADRGPAWRAYRFTFAWWRAERGDLAAARRDFEEAIGDGLSTLPRDVNWIAALASASEACILLGDADRARELRALLAPYARRMVVTARGASHAGSVAYKPARLAALCGDAAAADGLFADAARHDDAAGAPAFVVRDLQRHADFPACDRGRRARVCGACGPARARLVSPARRIRENPVNDRDLPRPMRAVTCTHGALQVVERPEPAPGTGQVRIEVLRCGICGSDLHARHGVDAWADMAAKVGYRRFARSDEPVVFGHEFSGRIVEYGPGCRHTLPTGTDVVALPLIRGPEGVDAVGLSVHAPGAYAEQMLVQESLMMPVPNGLDTDVAALTEPLAVGWHAVRRGELGKRTVAIVIGCGPIGLAVILMLKAKGIRTVVASDYSRGRRTLASACGADIVVDPAVGSPFTAAQDKRHLTDAPSAFELAIDTREKLERLPVGWWHTWRLAEALGAGPKHPVIFECVGVPGVIESILDGAPLFSRVVVVGVVVGLDQFTPAMAINKEIDVRFAFGYTPLEFRDTLRMLAEGKVDPRPLITGTVGLDGVDAAFSALSDPETHAKILIDPRSAVTLPGTA